MGWGGLALTLAGARGWRFTPPSSTGSTRLPTAALGLVLPRMVSISDAAASAIRAVFDQDGELSAAMEVRRQFPGIIDNERAREWARTIAAWKPLPEMRPQPRARRAR